MDRFAHILVRHCKVVVVVFVVLALVGAALIPFVKTNYNMVDYLPPEAQSTQAVALMGEEFDQAIPNASVLIHDVDLAQAQTLKERMASFEGVESVMWLDDVVDVATPLAFADDELVSTYYQDGAALFQLTIEEGKEVPAIEALRTLADEWGPGNAVAGEAMDVAQMQQATVEQVAMAVAIIVPVIMFLLIVSTLSWIEPLLFVGAIGVSILINMGTNIFLGSVSFITYSVSPILQLAVSLDYAIFLLHAFAAERQHTTDLQEAMVAALKRSTATIAASAVTTLFGFAALAFMQFQIGADLGLNLVKGIVISFITVVVFLPALTLCLVKAIDRTAHRRLMPTFATIGRPLARIRIPALILVVALAVPAFMAQSQVLFTYQNSTADPELRAGRDTLMIEEEFGIQNAVVLLVERGNEAAEAELAQEIAALPRVRSVMSYATAVGSAIPAAYLDEAVQSQFYSDDWARIIAYVDAPIESDEAFSTVEAIEAAAERWYPTYYAAGQSANLLDMRNIVAVDNVVVAWVAVIAIFLVVALTFKSLGLPVALLLAIECGIWINLAIPYFMGTEVNFIGYLVINTVQLGATIDYAILLTSHYLRWRQQMLPKPAMAKALGETFQSILVSAAILATAGFALALSSSMSAVSSLGLLLGRGALISLAMVTCFLPALLIYGDGFIRRTTYHGNFLRKGERP